MMELSRRRSLHLTTASDKGACVFLFADCC